MDSDSDGTWLKKTASSQEEKSFVMLKILVTYEQFKTQTRSDLKKSTYIDSTRLDLVTTEKNS